MVCSETIRNDVTISTPASAASGIVATGRAARYTTASSTTEWTIAAAARARAGADVDRGAGDRAGGGHAAEQPATRSMPGPGRRVRGRGRRGRSAAIVAATRADSSDSIAASAATASAAPPSDARRRSRSAAAATGAGRLRRQRADRVRPAGAAATRARSRRRRRSSDAGSARCIRGSTSIITADHRRPAPAVPPTEATSAAATRVHAATQRALSRRVRSAERRGHLLQEDDRRDAEREALDHRPGDERDGSAETA